MANEAEVEVKQAGDRDGFEADAVEDEPEVKQPGDRDASDEID